MLADVVVVVSTMATAAVVAWFALAKKHPENSASHRDEHPDTPAERFYGPHPSGPAGPDAEWQEPEPFVSAPKPPVA